MASSASEAWHAILLADAPRSHRPRGAAAAAHCAERSRHAPVKRRAPGYAVGGAPSASIWAYATASERSGIAALRAPTRGDYQRFVQHRARQIRTQV